MKYKRIFLVVLDSLGIGGDPNAYLYGDEGSNTLKHILDNEDIKIPNLTSLGLLDLIYKTNSIHKNSYTFISKEKSIGKDTTTGHWEMMGVHTTEPFITFTDTGFPKELIDRIETATGHKVIGNKAASGTEIIKELGEEQNKNNSLIVYTSADSVLQIAGHEKYLGLNELYRCCSIVREICMDKKWKVGRVIARPYIGENKDNYTRTSNRHDYSVSPPFNTVLDILKDNKLTVISIGKINDIFNGSGITESIKSVSNNDGMDKLIEVVNTNNFTGLCFTNLVEFDSEYGHRRNVKGYAKAIEDFDLRLSSLLDNLKDDDLLILTADHGNDPTWKGTDHTRECVPNICFSKSIKDGKQINTRESFADIGSTILTNFNLVKTKSLIGDTINEVLE